MAIFLDMVKSMRLTELCVAGIPLHYEAIAKLSLALRVNRMLVFIVFMLSTSLILNFLSS
jgi:hypothetical protein